jgi:hypothetical protein
MTISMVATDTLENFRQANRRVASVEACRESELAADAENRRSKAELCVNAMVMLRMTQTVVEI